MSVWGSHEKNPARPLGDPLQPHILSVVAFSLSRCGDPRPSQVTSGRFLKEVTPGTEALLKEGLAHGAETREGSQSPNAHSLPGALLEGPHHITLATCCDFRPSGCTAMPCMFGRWGTCSQGFHSPHRPLGLPFSHQTQCYKPMRKSNQPQHLEDACPAAGARKVRALEARRRGAALAPPPCPLTVLWDNIPFRSHRPICQRAALFVVMRNTAASRGPCEQLPLRMGTRGDWAGAQRRRRARGTVGWALGAQRAGPGGGVWCPGSEPAARRLRQPQLFSH